MARPRIYDQRVQRCVRLPAEMAVELEREAQRRDISFNLVVERACARWLDERRPSTAAEKEEPWDWQKT